EETVRRRVEGRVPDVAVGRRGDDGLELEGLALVCRAIDPQRAVRSQDLAPRGAVNEVDGSPPPREIGVLVVLAHTRAAVLVLEVRGDDDPGVAQPRLRSGTGRKPGRQARERQSDERPTPGGSHSAGYIAQQTPNPRAPATAVSPCLA